MASARIGTSNDRVKLSQMSNSELGDRFSRASTRGRDKTKIKVEMDKRGFIHEAAE